MGIIYSKSRRFEVVAIKAFIINILSRYYQMTTMLISSLVNMHDSNLIHHHAKHRDRFCMEDDYPELDDELSKFISLTLYSPINVDGIIEKIREFISV